MHACTFSKSAGTNASKDAVAYRKLVRSIEKPLLERYLKECSKAHKAEFKKLVAKGMALGEAKHVHSDYPDWALGEVIRAFWDMVD